MPAVDVLDLVMCGHEGSMVDFGDPSQPCGSWVSPGSAFGATLAAALYPGITPAEWAAVDNINADPVLIAALLNLWPTLVLRPFEARYRVTISG